MTKTRVVLCIKLGCIRSAWVNRAWQGSHRCCPTTRGSFEKIMVSIRREQTYHSKNYWAQQGDEELERLTSVTLLVLYVRPKGCTCLDPKRCAKTEWWRNAGNHEPEWNPAWGNPLRSGACPGRADKASDLAGLGISLYAVLDHRRLAALPNNQVVWRVPRKASRKLKCVTQSWGPQCAGRLGASSGQSSLPADYRYSSHWCDGTSCGVVNILVAARPFTCSNLVSQYQH